MPSKIFRFHKTRFIRGSYTMTLRRTESSDAPHCRTRRRASILANIRKRFLTDLIYTATGPILIALNPYKWLDLYGDEITARYHQAGALA